LHGRYAQRSAGAQQHERKRRCRAILLLIIVIDDLCFRCFRCITSIFAAASVQRREDAALQRTRVFRVCIFVSAFVRAGVLERRGTSIVAVVERLVVALAPAAAPLRTGRCRSRLPLIQSANARAKHAAVNTAVHHL
jgi:hypothetical protein